MIVSRATRTKILAFGLLAIFCVRVLAAMSKNAPTAHEKIFVATGYHFLRTGDFNLNAGNPIFLQALLALPLLSMHLALPSDPTPFLATDKSNYMQNWSYALSFYQLNHGVIEQLTFRSRLVTLALSLVLGIFIFLWSRDLYGDKGGLLSLLLYVFVPIVLSYSRLSTLNIGGACFAFVALYEYTKLLLKPTGGRLVATSIALAATILSKPSGIFLLLIFGLALLPLGRAPTEDWPCVGRMVGRIWRKPLSLAVSICSTLFLAWLLINLPYQFQGTWQPLGNHFSSVTSGLTFNGLVKSKLAALPFPFPAALMGPLQFIMTDRDIPGHLVAQYSSSGWWHYNLFALLTGPILILILTTALIVFLCRRSVEEGLLASEWILVIASAVYFGAVLVFGHGSVFSQMIPAVPFFLVLVGKLTTGNLRADKFAQASYIPICIWLLVGPLQVAAHNGNTREWTRLMDVAKVAAGASTRPTINFVSNSQFGISSTITWDTDSLSTSRVDYGTTVSYGNSASDPNLVRAHTLVITGLTCNTSYHYKVSSTNAKDLTTVSTDSTFTTDPCGSAGGPVSDSFNSTTLNTSLWTFVNPENDGSNIRLDGTHALISVAPITLHRPGVSGNRTVRIMQHIRDTDFEVEAKFDSVLKFPYQMQGIVVEQENSDLVLFDFIYDYHHLHFSSTTVTSNARHVQAFISIPDDGPPPLWLRVKRTGNTWTASWSNDGQRFSVATTFNKQLRVKRIGLFGGNSGANGDPAPAFTAVVDYFFNAASHIIPEKMQLPPQLGPKIRMWYGDNQTFGQNGIPQRWINILGNVSSPQGVASLTYSVNGGMAVPLAVPPNNFPVPSPRLVEPGDFNAEIDYIDLNPGNNTVVFTATDKAGNQSNHSVTVRYVAGVTWPANYSINWSNAPNIQSVVQVIDGRWQIQPDGTVRTTDIGYDRLLALGDMTAWKNYVVTTELTINAEHDWDHGFAVGIIVGWTGNTRDMSWSPAQPRTDEPTPGLGAYMTWWREPPNQPSLRIYSNEPKTVVTDDNSGMKLRLGVRYQIKLQVQANTSGGAHYSLKVWPTGNTEPSSWNLQSDGPASRGSVVLGAHMADISFGPVTVTALP